MSFLCVVLFSLTGLTFKFQIFNDLTDAIQMQHVVAKHSTDSWVTAQHGPQIDLPLA